MKLIHRFALTFAFFAAVSCFAQEQIKLDHPVRRIAGVVERENGEGVPNIDVEVFGGRSLIATAKTDGKGKFSTDHVEPGEYEVWFTYKPHPVFKDVIYKLTIDPKGSKEPIVVKLHPLR
jgi:hypothetical protein